MLTGLLPHGAAEALLFLVIAASLVFVVRLIVKRNRFAVPSGSPPALPVPELATEVRVQAIIRRLFRDPAQGEWVAEAAIGQRKFAFRPTDFTPETYSPLTNQKADFVLYGLATLVEGGIDAMRGQISDLDKANVTAESVRLVTVAGFANDYAVIGKVVSHRDEILDGETVTVYRTQVVRQDDLTLVLDLAVEPGPQPFADGAMVHGSARLFGRLAAA